MNSNNNNRAEDFLLGNNSKEKDSLISDSEKELAEALKTTIKSVGNEKLPSLEAAELWSRIQNSTLHAQNGISWRRYMQIAAILIVGLGIGIWQYQRNTSTHKLLDFAAQNINKKEVSKVKAFSKKHQKAPEFLSEEENIITANDFNTLVVGDGRRSAIHLPDGTKVWLNSGSKLIYPVTFTKDKREVYLEGEAYFDVAHNKEWPFFVRAKNLDIKVLGTEFYVSSNKDSKEDYAVLVNGSITFSTGHWLNKIEKILVPGERINYDTEKKELLVLEVKTEEFKAWKEGYVNITSETLDVIVQRVAKYYNIEISTAGLDLSHEKFTGRLDFQKSADDVLDILCFGTPYVYNSAERRLEANKN
ncbi:MAG TPA: FecR domain-containing protein [Pedobacter sp.]|nr:FecR domain-containing protein [Pedobacter sp.]